MNIKMFNFNFFDKNYFEIDLFIYLFNYICQGLVFTNLFCSTLIMLSYENGSTFFLHFFLKNVCEIKFIVYLCNE